MLEAPKNKMITDAPAKKELRGFHFAATAEHYAEYIEAESIQEAEAIYHKIKRAVSTQSTSAIPAIQLEQPKEQENAQ